MAKVGEDKDYRLLNGTNYPGWWCYAGRHRIGPAGLDVTFAKPEGTTSSAGVLGYLLFPAIGRLTSPAIRFEKGARPFHAEIAGTTPDGTKITLFGRWGRLTGTEMKWDDWEKMAEIPSTDGTTATEFTPKSEYFQWETRLYPTMKESPALSNIVLVRQ